jgi:hypothetical protein
MKLTGDLTAELDETAMDMIVLAVPWSLDVVTKPLSAIFLE